MSEIKVKLNDVLRKLDSALGWRLTGKFLNETIIDFHKEDNRYWEVDEMIKNEYNKTLMNT